MEEGEILGRWNKQGAGSERFPVEWLVTGELVEGWWNLRSHLVEEGLGRVEVG